MNKKLTNLHNYLIKNKFYVEANYLSKIYNIKKYSGEAITCDNSPDCGDQILATELTAELDIFDGIIVNINSIEPTGVRQWVMDTPLEYNVSVMFAGTNRDGFKPENTCSKKDNIIKLINDDIKREILTNKEVSKLMSIEAEEVNCPEPRNDTLNLKVKLTPTEDAKGKLVCICMGKVKEEPGPTMFFAVHKGKSKEGESSEGDGRPKGKKNVESIDYEACKKSHDKKLYKYISSEYLVYKKIFTGWNENITLDIDTLTIEQMIFSLPQMYNCNEVIGDFKALAEGWKKDFEDGWQKSPEELNANWQKGEFVAVSSTPNEFTIDTNEKCTSPSPEKPYQISRITLDLQDGVIWCLPSNSSSSTLLGFHPGASKGGESGVREIDTKDSAPPRIIDETDDGLYSISKKDCPSCYKIKKDGEDLCTFDFSIELNNQEFEMLYNNFETKYKQYSMTYSPGTVNEEGEWESRTGEANYIPYTDYYVAQRSGNVPHVAIDGKAMKNLKGEMISQLAKSGAPFKSIMASKIKDLNQFLTLMIVHEAERSCLPGGGSNSYYNSQYTIDNRKVSYKQNASDYLNRYLFELLLRSYAGQDIDLTKFDGYKKKKHPAGSRQKVNQLLKSWHEKIKDENYKNINSNGPPKYRKK